MYLFSALVLSICKAENWGVLVASSNTWDNYRHQADIAHAYQIAHANGIDDDHLIVMHYDDIANATYNPYPGQVFNKPTKRGTAGVDVYKNIKKDYTGRKVTAQTFLAVLTGNASRAGGKVLESTADDNVFVNLVDHGATGIVAFPTGPDLTREDLQAALQTMIDQKMFKQLTFYLEACEAGSMFVGMANNESIYVTTAANSIQSSYATYCAPNDIVDGKPMDTCLGDLYSVSWMEDCDNQKDGLTESLQTQYETIKVETDMSDVRQYGDLSFVNESVGQFLGSNPIPPPVTAATTPAERVRRASHEMGTVRSRDVPLHIAYYRYLRMDNTDLKGRHAAAEKLRQLLDAQVKADDFFLQLSIRVSGGTDAFFYQGDMTPCECCSTSYKAYQAACGNFDDYNSQYTRVIANLCQRGYTEQLLEAFRAMC